MGSARARGTQRGISREIIEIIKHRKDTNGLDEADAIVIELGREIFGTTKVASATFARSLRPFDRRGAVDLVALMGNYAGTAALPTAFEMEVGTDISHDQGRHPRCGGCCFLRPSSGI